MENSSVILVDDSVGVNLSYHTFYYRNLRILNINSGRRSVYENHLVNWTRSQKTRHSTPM